MKFYILTVLEDGSLWDANGVESRLRRVFGLDYEIDSLRKDLLRLVRQGLLVREKAKGVRRSYHYRINEKGRRRLAILRAKKREPEAVADLPRRPTERKRDEEKSLFDRWFEVVGSLRVCKDSLERCPNNAVVDYTLPMKLYWQVELEKMLSDLPAHLVWATEQVLSKSTFFRGVTMDDNQAVVSRMLLSMRTAERDFVVYCYLQEKREKEKYKAECRELKRVRETKACVDVGKLDSGFSAGFSAGLKLGRELGRYEATREQTLSIQRTVLDKIRIESEKDEESKNISRLSFCVVALTTDGGTWCRLTHP